MVAYGKGVGGQEHWHVLTMVTPNSGGVNIAKGDAVKLTGLFRVTNEFSAEDVVFGQAMAAATKNAQVIPVLVSGVAKFRFSSGLPATDGLRGVAASVNRGIVKPPASGNGTGRNLKTETTKRYLTLTSVAAGDAVTINGVTFTAHATATTPSERKYSISGDNAADAAALASVINDATYGVTGVTATVDGAVVTVAADDWDNTQVDVADAAATIAVAVGGGYVWTLL